MTPVRLPAAALAAALVCAAAPGSAAAAVSAPQVIAGPDASIAELGGIAMSADGTGGLVFRKVDATGSHIWASRFAHGTWTPPQRIDTALPYDSVQPRITAGDDGRLLAVWVQDYGHRGTIPQYQLQSATVAPGGRAFEPPVAVADDVSGDGGADGADAVDPDLSMNAAGVAYLTYRSVKSIGAAGLRPGRDGDTSSLFRIARFNGGTWSNVGTANRSSTSSVPRAAPGNGPEVSIDLQGNGLVAWLEPDDAGVERIWARRLYGTRLGLVQEISPATIGDQALAGDADAFALDGGGLGSGSIVFRQQPGLNSPLDGPRIMVARIPAPPDPTAAKFGAAVEVTSDSAALSIPAIASDDKDDAAVAYATGDAIRAGTLATPIDEDLPVLWRGATGPPLVAVGPNGALASAWPARFDDRAGVAVHQLLPDGTYADSQLAGPRGGPVTDLQLAGSGLGSALVGFVQGGGPDTQVVAAAVRVPPLPITITGPKDWTKPRLARITWNRPATATGPVSYAVVLDGRAVGRGLTIPIARLPISRLDDGEHLVVVRATDGDGDVTDSKATSIYIDAHAPVVSAKIDRSRRLRIRVRDNAEGEGSGVDPDATQVRFGDGTTGSGPSARRHRYRRHGRYRVVVQVADFSGNTRTVILKVTA